MCTVDKDFLEMQLPVALHQQPQTLQATDPLIVPSDRTKSGLVRARNGFFEVLGFLAAMMQYVKAVRAVQHMPHPNYVADVRESESDRNGNDARGESNNDVGRLPRGLLGLALLRHSVTRVRPQYGRAAGCPSPALKCDLSY